MIQLELELDQFEPMIGTPCVLGCGGIYSEMSLHDDWEGKVTCNNCRHRIDHERRIFS